MHTHIQIHMHAYTYTYHCGWHPGAAAAARAFLAASDASQIFPAV